MFNCKQCNKVFNSELALRGHSRIHSPKETIRIKEKQENYKSQKTKVFNGFIDNKYTKIYYAIIESARKKCYTGYTEKHHILPRSLGGKDTKDNLIILSAREHFLCHYLLTKMIDKNTTFYHKMVKAFMSMSACRDYQKRYVNSRLYNAMKSEFSKTQSIYQAGEKNSQYGTTWVSDVNDEISKKIKKKDIEEYLSEGWIMGRITNFKKYKEKLIPKIRNTISNCKDIQTFYNMDSKNKIIHEKFKEGLSTRKISSIVGISHVVVSKRIKVIKAIKNPAH